MAQGIFATIILCLTMVCVSSASIAANDKKPLILGVVPQQSAVQLHRHWSPILLRLSHALHRPVRFATAPKIDVFEDRCKQGKYDIVYMNPYHYVVFAKQPGYRVIANQSDKKLKGIFVTRKNSSIQTLSDIEGETLHLPSPNAFAASLLTRAILKKKGINFKVHYAGSHDAVYRNVSRDIANVGGGVVRTFKAQPKRLAEKLRILEYTEGYTPHAIAVHPRVSQEDVEKIRNTLLNLPSSMLATLKFNRLKSAVDEDYDDIRALGITAELGSKK